MRRLHECSDEELLLRVVAFGDQVAFGTLVERYEARMLRLCLHMLHQPQDAEDACQAAFLVLWKKGSESASALR